MKKYPTPFKKQNKPLPKPTKTKPQKQNKGQTLKKDQIVILVL